MEDFFYTINRDPEHIGGHLHNYFDTKDWDSMVKTMELLMLMGPTDPVYGRMWINYE